MLDFVIFAVTFVVVLIIAVVYLYPGSNKTTTVPGLDPSDPKDGNLADIEKAGSLHEFLQDLHGDHGPIASFWMGQQLVVSLACTDLFKQHANVFDVPAEMFEMYEPLLGMESLQFMNGAEARKRRTAYDKCFTASAISNHCQTFQKLSMELCDKMATLPKDEHVPLKQFMCALVIKALTQATCGSLFDDPREILNLHKHYDVCWTELESQVKGDMPDESREKRFEESKEEVHNIMRKAILQRSDDSKKNGDGLLIDVIIKAGTSEPQMVADLVTFLQAGFHTTAMWLTWCLYFLATHQPIQDRVCRELQEVFSDKPITQAALKQLVFLRQVLDETLRCAVLIPWTARSQDIVVELGGHKIPGKTPVIHALGVVLQDQQLWPLPNSFDPSRFDPDARKDHPEHSFEPFGFAGRRKCPAHEFAYTEVSIVLAVLLKKFKVTMVEGQVVKPVYGLVSTPRDEVWLTTAKRE